MFIVCLLLWWLWLLSSLVIIVIIIIIIVIVIIIIIIIIIIRVGEVRSGHTFVKGEVQWDRDRAAVGNMFDMIYYNIMLYYKR